MDRLCCVWDATAKAARKPFGYKDVLPVHSAAAMYLHFVDILEARSPSGDFLDAKPRLYEQFIHGSMDNELLQVATSSVPPGDIMAISGFRSLGLLGGLVALLWSLEHLVTSHVVTSRFIVSWIFEETL